MEQLDKVYDTFVNLESNYSRSKKTREEYLLSKFGGDINTGSFLIMHALTQQELTDPEDIDKLSTIRQIFSAIKDSQSHLGTLTSLNFLETVSTDELCETLTMGETSGTGVHVVKQSELYRSKRDPMHYHANDSGSDVTPFSSCRYYNTNIPALLAYAKAITGGKVKAGQLVERIGMSQGEVVENVVF